MPQAPDETYNLGAQLELPVGNNMNFYARVDFQHVGEMWFHTLQGEATPNIWDGLFGTSGLITTDFSKTQRDAYDTVNLRIGFEAKNWSATIWGRNITDEEYLEEVIPAAEFGGRSYIRRDGDLRRRLQLPVLLSDCSSQPACH